ncbi:methyl-accepting chemotaxis protein/methyl-accepting chemotaxis protein-1 (serine sensor receptor) [Sphaerotilus hippei]|uniref:Methyl-accepting chemotaxis protein/methyl-accepting chemotaxis protein-1 (Serine sensor receptor) n=1 Tax=Sphaerotilus hippei TaxID=744406 RepID=A0A318H605_9BURK|nr:methyl-accepting chemotaxis protein [Sphaerotilus hippei]PXW99380.1 methyl-accepting chemotaxis protein/methyl-accepting chemotaxis protein-1 (serine sensor receptor) [Sphaerotilus hippei]
MNIVKQSLYLCIGALLLLLGLQGAQSLWQVSRLSGAAEAIATSSAVSNQSQTLGALFVRADEQFKAATAFVDAATMAEHRKAVLDSITQLRSTAAAIQAAAQGDTQALAVDAARQVDQWAALAGQHLSSEGQTELPSYHRLEGAGAALTGKIAELVARSHEAELAAMAVAASSARSAWFWTIGELVLAIGLGLGLGWYALSSLRRQIGGDPAEVAAIANAVADGDLSIEIRTAGIPEGSVMAATARMQRSLRETVQRVRQISLCLSEGAGEIASGNADLSARTEQQASALEKTASTMTQLGQTVRHNAESSREADQLARGASTIATRGGEVVGQVVHTMQDINSSSRKIVDIITVIDGIAFQTNILALNAAVEAARAGEQGRGFAVVASEVRSLAQRSADAAKEIKSLITASVEQVEQGSDLVDQAGSTMQEIVAAVQRVTAIMSEISGASEQQSAGVSQVAGAVTEMDQATQQNAALAEQSAAAAESLKAQTQQLVEAMAVFRMDTAAQAASRAGPDTWNGADRRGPDRAKNVVRAPFSARADRPGAAAPQQESTSLAAPARTGTDDWETF